jgi:hypothetical protein
VGGVSLGLGLPGLHIFIHVRRAEVSSVLRGEVVSLSVHVVSSGTVVLDVIVVIKGLSVGGVSSSLGLPLILVFVHMRRAEVITVLSSEVMAFLIHVIGLLTVELDVVVVIQRLVMSGMGSSLGLPGVEISIHVRGAEVSTMLSGEVVTFSIHIIGLLTVVLNVVVVIKGLSVGGVSSGLSLPGVEISIHVRGAEVSSVLRGEVVTFGVHVISDSTVMASIVLVVEGLVVSAVSLGLSHPRAAILVHVRGTEVSTVLGSEIVTLSIHIVSIVVMTRLVVRHMLGVST